MCNRDFLTWLTMMFMTHILRSWVVYHLLYFIVVGVTAERTYMTCKHMEFHIWDWNPSSFHSISYNVCLSVLCVFVWYPTPPPVLLNVGKQRLLVQDNINGNSLERPRLGWVGMETYDPNSILNFLPSRAPTNHPYCFSGHIKLFIPKLTKIK